MIKWTMSLMKRNTMMTELEKEIEEKQPGVQPAQPAQPAIPAKPAQPAKPAKPVQQQEQAQAQPMQLQGQPRNAQVLILRNSTQI